MKALDGVPANWKPSETDGLWTGLWTAKQAAEFLQVHERTVVRWAKAGVIPALRAGRCWRFVPDELNRWALEQSSKSQLSLVRRPKGEE